MQPAFIRIIDNIRKQLDDSTWKGKYEDRLVWPEGTSDVTQQMVTALIQESESATPERAEEIEQTLRQLPLPHRSYLLHLEQQGQQVVVDLWELCYQVCFSGYATDQTEPVEIDRSLIDETGEVDWQALDAKTKELVEQVFVSLPVSG